MTAQHRDENNGVERITKNVVSTAIEIIKTDECSNEEYIDYEYIHSD